MRYCADPSTAVFSWLADPLPPSTRARTQPSIRTANALRTSRRPSSAPGNPAAMPAQKKKLTVAELKALKGKRKIVLCTAFDEWTARAAEEAGVDMLVAWGADWESTKYVVAQVRKGGKLAPASSPPTQQLPAGPPGWLRFCSRGLVALLLSLSNVCEIDGNC